MRSRLRSSAARALLAAATASAAALMLVAVAAAEAGDGISATGASIDKVGWWHFANFQTATPAAIVTVPPPPGVPAGTLAVGAAAGDPDRIAAIGILPDAQVGDSVTTFSLSIREAGSPAAGFNGEAAKITACPITAFWVGGENGTWDTRPTYDCELASAEGVRADDGTWTFDLLAVGRAWLDPGGSIAPDGVVLVEAVDAPEGFQTVFATSGEGAIVVTFAFTPGAGNEPEPPIDDGGAFDSGSDGFVAPAFGSPDIPVGGLPSPDIETPSAGETPQGAPPVEPRTIAHTGPNVLGNLPGGLVLMVPLFLGLLGLLTYSLGPAGEPVAATRQRGVSRALAARARVASDARSSSFPETM
ncbi:MAG: hypothetical protein WD691_00420 [Acidimicrobiales bacterium]